MGQLGAVDLAALGPHYLLETVRADEERRNSAALRAQAGV